MQSFQRAMCIKQFRTVAYQWRLCFLLSHKHAVCAQPCLPRVSAFVIGPLIDSGLGWLILAFHVTARRYVTAVIIDECRLVIDDILWIINKLPAKRYRPPMPPHKQAVFAKQYSRVWRLCTGPMHIKTIMWFVVHLNIGKGEILWLQNGRL